MKTNNKIKIVLLIGALALSGCGLNSTDDGTLVAGQARGSRTGNITVGGSNQLAIDSAVPKPAASEWAEVKMQKMNLEKFLSVAEGKSVTIPLDSYNSAGAYFWGQFESTDGTGIRLGDRASEENFFKNLNKNKFNFEMQIWDKFTNGTTSDGKKVDYLGYAFFGRSTGKSAGELISATSGDTNDGRLKFVLQFRDTLGDVYLIGEVNRSTRQMTGGVVFTELGNKTSTVGLGNFQGLKGATSVDACKFLKCQ